MARPRQLLLRTSILSATLASVCQAQTAPVLGQTSFTPTPQNEDTVGVYDIMNLFGTAITDAESNPEGIAIVGVDTAAGTWEYRAASTGAPNPWVPIGAVSESRALLMEYFPITSPAQIRFTPAADRVGVVPAALTFRAWDRTQGTGSGATPSYFNLDTGTPAAKPGRAVAAPPAAIGGTTAFSTALGALNVTLTAVQDAPRLDAAGSSHLNAEAYGVSSAGTTVVELLATGAGGDPVSDPDAGASTGIIIVGATGSSYGTWEYTTDGSFWNTMTPGVDDANGLLLAVGMDLYSSGSVDTRVRFVPSVPTFSGTLSAALTYRAWDQTNFVGSGNYGNATVNGGGTPYSTAIETVSLVITSASAAAATPVSIPQPTLSGRETIYCAISPGTPEGVTSLRAAVAGAGRAARAFAWDGTTDAFVELPQQPSGGLHAGTGVFLATRVALPIDAAGTRSALPYAITLHPGWNFVGVPLLDNAGTAVTSHPWNHFELYDETGATVTIASDFTDALGTPAGAIDTARPWLWDGASYSQVTTLETGRGYWIKNNTSTIHTLRQVGAPVPPVVRAAAGAAAARSDITDRGTPPRPPGSAAASDAGGGACGLGGAAGIVLAAIALARRRRESSDRLIV